MKTLWALDDGHGKETRGKCSPDTSVGVLEYEFNQDIARRIREIIGAHVDTELLSPGDSDTSLRNRVRNLARLKQKHGRVMLLSIHGNAASENPDSPYFDGVLDGWTGARGATTFHHPNAVDGGSLAQTIELFYRNFTDIKSRGVKTARFYLLNGANRLGIPAALHECAFMTNRDNAKLMRSDAGRDTIAKALSAGIIEIENRGTKSPEER